MTDVDRMLAEEDAAWRAIGAAFERVPHDRFEEPALTPEGWSPKDAMFHVAGWMAECACHLEHMRRGVTEVPHETRESIERQNRAWFEISRTMSPQRVRERFEESHRRMVEAFGALDEPTVEAVEWFEESGALHHRKHIADLERFLAQADA
ncbi:MAG TPA: maleylpyruvate isomerase N-terminal domain-containing protein [Actinomycetota bacterium]